MADEQDLPIAPRGSPLLAPTRREGEQGREEGAATANADGRSAGGRQRREELAALQIRGIAAILSQPTIAAAANEIGVHPRTIARWFTERAFSEEYERQMTELQLELWRRMLSVRNEVWDRFLDLLVSADERIALRLTTWFLDRMLAVPAILTRNRDQQEGPGLNVPPRLRALLETTAAGQDEDENEDEPA